MLFLNHICWVFWMQANQEAFCLWAKALNKRLRNIQKNVEYFLSFIVKSLEVEYQDNCSYN